MKTLSRNRKNLSTALRLALLVSLLLPALAINLPAPAPVRADSSILVMKDEVWYNR